MLPTQTRIGTLTVSSKIIVSSKIGQYNSKMFTNANGQFVKWEIDSFSTRQNDCFSPNFSFAMSTWSFVMKLNGESQNNSDGYISLYLRKEESLYLPPHSMTIKLGFKDRDRTYKWIHRSLCLLPKEMTKMHGSPKFMQLSSLLRDELTPNDIFTVTCCLSSEGNIEPYCHVSGMVRFAENLESMFLEKRLCDFTLKVKHQEFGVHKVILAARSPVFAAMVETNMQEKTNCMVVIEDCDDPMAFRDFLLFLYSGKLKSNSDNILEVYRIADKYCVQDLKLVCVDYFLRNLTAENVLDATVLAETFDEDKLKTEVYKCFVTNFEDIIPTSKWKSFHEQHNHLSNLLLNSMAKRMKQKKIKIY